MRRNYSRRSGSPLFYFLLGPLLLFLLFRFGSYLLEPPPLPVTPTPVPTAQSFGESLLVAASELLDFEVGKQTLDLAVGQLAALDAG